MQRVVRARKLSNLALAILEISVEDLVAKCRKLRHVNLNYLKYSTSTEPLILHALIAVHYTSKLIVSAVRLQF